MNEVFGYIDRHFDRFVEELADLVRIPSISAQARGLEACADHLVGCMKTIGLHAEIMPMGTDFATVSRILRMRNGQRWPEDVMRKW